MSAVSAVTSKSLATLPAPAEKIKKLDVFKKYFAILKAVKWNTANEALLDKYIVSLTSVFNENPISAVMSNIFCLDEVGKTVYELWESGNFKESADLITQFFSDPKNHEKGDLFCFRWTHPQSEFILHYLNALPANLDRIDFGAFHLRLNADAQIDLIVTKFPNVQSLSMREGITAASAIKVANLSSLNYLCFTQCRTMTKPGALAIAKGNFPKLTQLYLSYTNRSVDDEVLIAIANNPHFSNLEYLHIHEAKITNKGLQAVVQSPHLKKLKALCFDNDFKVDDNIQKTLKSRGLIH